jgi:tRNA-binding protein
VTRESTTTDPTAHEPRFRSRGSGFDVGWLEQLPSEWAALGELLAWLEDRAPGRTRWILPVDPAGEDPMGEFRPAPVKAEATVADLEKLDIRVGTIVSVEEVPGSSKLLRLTVDLGDHRRRILAGMKGERSNPLEIVGLQALFVVNLAPRRMAGEVSEGMLFDIGYADGLLPALCLPERPVPAGARAG